MKTILINGELYDSAYLLYTIEGQKILEKARKEKRNSYEPNIFCVCKGKLNPVPMHAKMKPKDEVYSYTLSRNPKTMHHHSPECIRYSDELKIENDEVEDKDIELDKVSKKSNDTVKNEKWEKAILYSNSYKIRSLAALDTDVIYEEVDRVKTKSRYTQMYTMLEKITTYAWYSYVTDKSNIFNPKEGNLFHYIYTKLNDMEIRHSNLENEKNSYKKIELGKILLKPYKNKKNEDITNQLLMKRSYVVGNKIERHKTLVIGKYLSHRNIDDENIEIKLEDPYQKNYYFIYGSKKQIQNGLKFLSEAALYVIAFIVVENNRPTIDRMASMPVLNGRGIYVESSYEIDYAEELIEKNILFFRPPKSENPFKKIFNGYIPDFLLLDKSEREISTICEVFGYKKDDDNEVSKKYWKQANEKMKYYDTLRDRYYTNYWYPLGKESINVFDAKLKKRKD